jgi:hypothetical protein
MTVPLTFSHDVAVTCVDCGMTSALSAGKHVPTSRGWRCAPPKSVEEELRARIVLYEIALKAADGLRRGFGCSDEPACVKVREHCYPCEYDAARVLTEAPIRNQSVASCFRHHYGRHCDPCDAGVCTEHQLPLTDKSDMRAP